MARLRSLWSDNQGAAAVEFVFAVPVLVTIIWGIFQLSLVLEAQAGVQQALGEGARLATVYDPSTGASKTDTAILSKITSSKFGTGSGTFYTACPDTCISTDSTAKTKTITVTYKQSTNFLFFAGPDVTIKKSKVVYYPN